MGIANVTWEDEENNRQVQFSVAYAIENEALTIREVTPQSVSFLCSERAAPIRSIRVHTATGRRVLVRQFKQSPQFASVARQLTERQSALTA
jgi:hypothetical protein